MFSIKNQFRILKSNLSDRVRIGYTGYHGSSSDRPTRRWTEVATSTILVTGGSGFISSPCILQLLAAGHEVRTTVRNLNRAADVRTMLNVGGAEPGDRLSLVAADLEGETGWPEAVAGCEYVLHVASPLPPNLPRHADLVRIAAIRDPAVRQILPEFGKVKSASNEKARRMLGWTPRSSEDALVATAESLVRFGLSKDNLQVTRDSSGATSPAMR
jgi:nucleoside-diphosphate-sugar epimerase